jgi:Kef-type K+ transport system membrane component KefB
VDYRIAAAASVPADDVTGIVLGDLALVLLAAFGFARLAVRLRQPATMGEIVAGIALGPSLLGLLPGNLSETLFPASARPYLQVLAQLGLVLFMFGIGYRLDVTHLRGLGRQVTAISLSAVALPFALGCGLAALLYPWFDRSELNTTSALGPALFIGTAMAITAFPVLARILVERGLENTWLGTAALVCAAAQDFLAWCVLAVVVAVATAGSPWSLAGTGLASAGFVLGLVFLVRPGVRWLLAPERRWPNGGLLVHTVVVCGLLACAWLTIRIGFHGVFGAFAFGAAMPKRRIDAVAPEIPQRIEQTSTLLLPVFFTVTGLSVDFSRLGGQGLVMVAAVIVVACAGKFAGAFGAARLTGVDRGPALALGILMNARGLTELIILSVGRSLGMLDSRMFTVMVIMALVTTIMTGPLLRRVPVGERATGRFVDTDFVN